MSASVTNLRTTAVKASEITLTWDPPFTPDVDSDSGNHVEMYEVRNCVFLCLTWYFILKITLTKLNARLLNYRCINIDLKEYDYSTNIIECTAFSEFTIMWQSRLLDHKLEKVKYFGKKKSSESIQTQCYNIKPLNHQTFFHKWSIGSSNSNCS